MTGVTLWLHPGTTLQRTMHQHMHHFSHIREEILLLVHIGTNNVASGDSPYDILRGMLELIDRISGVCQHEVRFAICSILPRPVDDASTKFTIKEANRLLEHLSFQKEGVIYLRTNRLFLKHSQPIRSLYCPDRLHLNDEGKRRLFYYLNRFLFRYFNR